jgi:hypothetical protein
VQLSILQSLEPFRDRSGVASGSCTTERCGLQVEMQNDLHILYVLTPYRRIVPVRRASSYAEAEP